MSILAMDKWKQLSDQLYGYCGHAKIVADGYQVSFYKKIGKGEKLVIDTYVNDYMKGAWMNAEDEKPTHPEGRFFRPIKKSHWKKKDYKMLKSIYGKKEADEKIKPKVIMFSPVWGSSRTLIAHLKRNFPDLEIVDENESKKSA